jgi:hypothetical protein
MRRVYPGNHVDRLAALRGSRIAATEPPCVSMRRVYPGDQVGWLAAGGNLAVVKSQECRKTRSARHRMVVFEVFPSTPILTAPPRTRAWVRAQGSATTHLTYSLPAKPPYPDPLSQTLSSPVSRFLSPVSPHRITLFPKQPSPELASRCQTPLQNR